MNAERNAAEAAIRARADAADVLACEKLVETLAERRAAAIVSAKPTAVLKTDSALLTARVSLEISQARAAGSSSKHTAAVDAAKAERSAKAQRVVAVMNFELEAMAAEFLQDLEVVLGKGARLQDFASRNLLNVPVNVSMPPVPAAVVAALKRMPPLDPYNTPVHILRNGTSSTAWADRFAELMAADDESFFDVAADHKPRDGVGSLSRAADFS